MRALVGLVLLLTIVAIIVLFTASAAPVVVLPAGLNAIGQATPVAVKMSDPHGIRSAAAYLEQNGERYKVADLQHPTRRFAWLHHAPDETFQFTAGVRTTPQLKEGSARLIVEATSNDFRGQTT